MSVHTDNPHPKMPTLDVMNFDHAMDPGGSLVNRHDATMKTWGELTAGGMWMWTDGLYTLVLSKEHGATSDGDAAAPVSQGNGCCPLA